MPSRRTLFVLFLLLAALPLPSFADDVLLVIVDLPHHRALVPAGSIIPAGMTIHAEPVQGRGRALDRPERGIGAEGRASIMQRNVRHPLSPPLTIEFAPAERFVEARKHYDAQQLAAAASRRARGQNVSAKDTQTCFPTYVTDSQTGVYGTYYNGFTSTFCQPANGFTPGNAYLWGFTAEGDYTDDDEWIDPYVAVYDDNNNFNCFQISYGWSSPLSCTASATTMLLNTGCLNHVTTASVLYTIEYLSGYQPNYLSYVLSVDYCTYFY